MALQITGVTKDESSEIVGVCGPGWKDTAAGVIADIQANRYQYWVSVSGYKADVVVVPASGYHRAYLKTTADTSTVNNLDSLGPCS